MVTSHKSCGEGLWIEPQLWIQIQRYPGISGKEVLNMFNYVQTCPVKAMTMSVGVIAKVSMPRIYGQLRHVRPVFAQEHAIKSQDPRRLFLP